MRPTSFLLCGFLAACAGSAPPRADPSTASTAPPAHTVAEHAAVAPPPKAMDEWKNRAVDESCRASLGSLAGGELDSFRGLGRCGRVDAEAALGSSGDQPSKFEQFGEYRVYPRAGGSVLVWFLADDIRVLQLLYPKLKRPIKELLGEPEARSKSSLSPEWEQWIYAGRGLTAHVKRGSTEVITLFAYRPTTVEAFLQTDIARVAKSEAPLEELK